MGEKIVSLLVIKKKNGDESGSNVMYNGYGCSSFLRSLEMVLSLGFLYKSKSLISIYWELTPKWRLD